VIDNFRDEYLFLSNFYATEICLLGLTYKNAEAAFQAQKTLDPFLRKQFCGLDPSAAKAIGRTLPLRSDWEDVKVDIMKSVLEIKFSNPFLEKELMKTKQEILVEGNNWGDTFWGVCGGKGKNMLGKLLMEIREKKEQKHR